MGDARLARNEQRGVPRRPGSSLAVGYAGETRHVAASSELSFGRMGDVVIDDNPYMHRIVGRFLPRGDLWWLQNVGARIVLELADCASASLYLVKPGAESPLHFSAALVRFQAGRANYQLEVSVQAAPAQPPMAPVVGGVETITSADLPMTPDQLRLVLSLAEAALRDPLARELRIPSNRQAAQRLGWTLTRFNRKLDNVCQKLAKRGVPGLHGDVGELAIDRRKRLVTYSIESGLVGPAHLPLLELTDVDVTDVDVTDVDVTPDLQLADADLADAE